MHEAFKRYADISNQAPVYYRGMIERNMETIRRKLATEFGADPEEIAITRNASESLQIAQDGLISSRATKCSRRTRTIRGC